jgi:hypothetical protein
MGEPRTFQGCPPIANLPVGAFWTRANGVPLNECQQAAKDLDDAWPAGYQWWMDLKRSVN